MINLEDKFQAKIKRAHEIEEFIEQHIKSIDEFDNFIIFINIYGTHSIIDHSVFEYETELNKMERGLIASFRATNKSLNDTIPYICTNFKYADKYIVYMFFITDHNSAEETIEYMMKNIIKYRTLQSFS